MKLVITIATSVTIASTVSLITAYDGHVERELILSGEVVPSGTKTYVAGLRLNRDSDSLCGGSLISPTHVLTASHCTAYAPHWVSIGEHYRNGTEVGEQIKIVSMMNHPNYSENVLYADDFMIVELERPSKFQPVKMAAADDSDFKTGKIATTMGWGTNAETNGNFSYELQRVDLPLVSDEACAAYATVDSSMVCAGGVANHDSCMGDSGGPLIVESAEGDVLIGIVSWSKDDTSQLSAALHPFQRAVANDWVRLLFYVDVASKLPDDSWSVETLPHFLLEVEEEIAANIDDEFFAGGFAARASALPVGALFTIDETRQHLHGAVRNYFELPDVALDSYLVYGNETELLPPPPLLT
ncbi:Serine protease trypsin-like protein [Phytophthora palmivora]|uniref:Serine protease trypsin-like protein n=1 Tax=Phytophthora palmivora TaxID=4796 RepID=A0A2P4YAQ9_9STRA|nr:Serine protease trypsin-like protein [Phytophthora palmivora]